MVSVWGVIKGIFKALFVVVIALLEAITVSFYKNIKKRYEKRRDEYLEVKTPTGYRDEKLEPEYKDLSPTKEFADFSGLPGFK